MKLVSGLALIALSVVSEAVAGVGAWTATPNPDALTVVVGSDGAVVTDWGRGDAWLSYQIARSADHGSTWQPSTGPGGVISFYQTRALAVDPAGAIYAGFTTAGNASYFARLFVSRDSGASWTELLEDYQTLYFDLRVDSFSSQTLYLLDGLGAPSRLRRSEDGGATWAEIDRSIVGALRTQAAVSALALDPQTRDRLYAATVVFETVPWGPATPVLFASGDGGSTWTRSTTNLAGVFATLVVDPFRPSKIYGGGASGIFRSDDAGQTFVSRSAVATVEIVADPLHSGRLYAATMANGVLASSDGGATWTPLNAGLTNLAVNALAIDAAGGYLYAATSTGVFVYRFPDAGLLVLNGAHPFSVTLSATDQRTGRTGPGVATPVNDLWGYFSIPAITSNPNNPEVFVKMLDGTAINEKYWFFYGGLTDLEYTLTVTEDATGIQKTYTKPAGSECGGSDTAAFGP